MRWTLLIDGDGHPGWWQMALDEALLEEAAARGAGFVRLYQWAPYALSFGRHEPALRRYDRARLEAAGIDTVRRPTGGRAVWHAAELTYAVAAPIGTLGGLTQSHRRIHETIADALGTLGVTATLAPSGEREHPALGGACFASAAGGELLVHGRKLVGSAQLRRAGALLQHGSLLLAGDQAAVLTYARSPQNGGGATTLEAAGGPRTFRETAAALTLRFREWEGEWSEPGDDFDPTPLVARHADRYRDPAWTWRR
ncbi:MAG TPA: hypothetical protein VMG41_03425 [Gemmatimonadales bacterium]|nr:hypothetical protein [Gemmatimonadales bacterium]